MEKFAFKLTKDAQSRLYEIRTSRAANKDKAWEAVCFLEEQIARLRERAADYVFPTQKAEIRFFRHTKPQLLSWLLYAYDVYGKGKITDTSY